MEYKILSEAIERSNMTSADIITETSMVKYLLESAFVGILCILLLALGTSESSVVIPIIIVGLVRMLPYLSNILSSLQLIRAGSEVVDRFTNYVENLNQNPPLRDQNTLLDEEIYIPSLSAWKPLSFKKTYPELLIKTGTLSLLSGSSGSGKSVYLDIIAGNGITSPAATVRLPDGSTIPLSRNEISYVQQDVYSFDKSILDNIILKRQVSNADVIKAIQTSKLDEAFNLDEMRQKYLNADENQISGGQLQRIMIARALLTEPKLLIIDETLSGVPELTEMKILISIRKNYPGMTVLITSHRSVTHDYVDNYYHIA